LLIQRGEKVWATTRKPERADAFRAQGIEPVHYDVLQGGPLPAVDAVVHAVGLDRSQNASMRDVYVQGLARVAEATATVPRFVQVSSTSVYAQTDGSWVRETDPTEPTEESGRVVLEAEQTLQIRRPDAMILRFAGIYGPGRRIGETALKAARPIPGDPDKWLNLIHVQDGAAAVVAALDRGHGLLNIADGQPVQRRDYYAFLATLLGAAKPVFTPTGDPVNRRIDAQRMRQELGLVPHFADYRAGLADS
jgi:nucleoside-diphosphate-sugar epimerase